MKHPATATGTRVPVRQLFALGALLAAAFVQRASAEGSPQPLPFTQDWTSTSLISAADDWSAVPGIEGYFVNGIPEGTDPQALVDDFGPAAQINVIANQINLTMLTPGGVAEFHLANPVVALQGGGPSARAAFLLVNISTVGRTSAEVFYNVRDIDGSTRNAVQPVALQYRVGAAGPFTNLPAGFVADATTGPSMSMLVTPKSVALPADALDQPLVQLRIMTTNAVNGDEWVGIDDIRIGVPRVPIYDIQGSGARSPYEGQPVTTEGIVTGRAQNRIFVQTQQGDGDPATSDGITIVGTAATPIPAMALPRALVSVFGTVQEVVPEGGGAPVTQIAGAVTITRAATATPLLPLPTPIELTATFPDPDGPPDQLEPVEGMRVHAASLTAVGPTQGTMNPGQEKNGVFDAVITGVPRPFRAPGVGVSETLPAGAPANVPRFDENPERLRVAGNPSGLNLAPRMNLATGDVLTCVNSQDACVNDTTGTDAGIEGVLDYAFHAYTLLVDPPQPPGMVILNTQQPAAKVPSPDSSQFTVASFNVQRLVVATGLDVRLDKLSATVKDVMQSPDVIGVQEVTLATLQMLAGEIGGYASHLIEGNDAVLGLDVGFLVKTSRVQVVEVRQEGKHDVFQNPATLENELLFDRPPLLLRATIEGAPVTFIVTQLHPMTGINDPVDGARVRARRAAQAQFLANLIQARQAADPRERIMSLGDYAAFEFNDGLVDVMGTIRGVPAPPDEVVLATGPGVVDPPLTNVLEGASPDVGLPPDQRYSVVADGSAQAVDHVLMSANLAPHFAGAQFGRVNADFPESLRSIDNDPRRSSNHDPLVAYFFLPVAASIGDVVTEEGDDYTTRFKFIVRLDRPSSHPLTIDFQTEDGSATAGRDYSAGGGTLTFAPGETEQRILVFVDGDQTFELDETFAVKLTNPQGPGLEIADGTATGTILNDDAAPTLSVGDVVVSEGNAGTGTASFSVVLIGASETTATVDFTTSDGTALQGSDYFGESGRLEFLPGETTKTIHVTVNGDLLNEPDEIFAVNLTNPVNAAASDPQAIGTIRNDDPLPTVRVNDVRGDEPAAGTSLMTFTAELSAPSGQTISVEFATQNLTAVAGSDYQSASGTLLFAPGQTTQTIDVTVLGDTAKEFAEFFVIRLARPVNATIVDAFAVGTIDDLDQPRIDFFAPAAAGVGETITITGANFRRTIAVKFNGAPARFSTHGSTEIRAQVPAGATTGTITVTTLRGMDTSDTPFVVVPRPVIGSFTPESGAVGDTVIINGINLSGALDVKFNGVSAPVLAATGASIRTVVPPGATTGSLRVTTPDGFATSRERFSVRSKR